MNFRSLFLLFVSLTISHAAENPAPPARVEPVSYSQLCVTEGSLQEKTGSLLAVDTPKMRAVVAAASTDAIADVRLRYLGPTSHDAPLGSGEMRRQFALKLRAQDACNLVYASWRIEPKSQLVVSIKSNPGQSTSAECANRGYRNIKPSHSSPVPELKKGEFHSFHAEMNGSKLNVTVDGNVVWEGDLGREVLALKGPVGVRSDNGRFEFELSTAGIKDPGVCRKNEGD